MPRFIEDIAFQPPDREGLTFAMRDQLGLDQIPLIAGQPLGPEAGAGAGTGQGAAPGTGTAGGTSQPQAQAESESVDTSCLPAMWSSSGSSKRQPRHHISFLVASPDGRRAVGGVRAQQRVASWSGLIILFAHGNAEDLRNAGYYWRLATETQCLVVAYDYLGYGFSSGTKDDCTEANACKVVHRMLQFLTDECGKDRSRIIAMGRSLGSGSASELAAVASKEGRPLAGLILYSPLYSAVACTGRFWCTGLYDMFRNYKRVPVAAMRTPVLIVHGTRDEVIPFECARRLFAECGGKPRGATASDETAAEAANLEATPKSKRVCFRPMQHCHHNDIENRQPRAFYDELRVFLQKECSGGSGGAAGASTSGGAHVFAQPGAAVGSVLGAGDDAWRR